ncbi:MAG: hypothetical protein ACTSQJ_07140 [Promethearchaeota archaeon]
MKKSSVLALTGLLFLIVLPNTFLFIGRESIKENKTIESDPKASNQKE